MNRPISLKTEYGDFWKDARSYYICYGGFWKIVWSPYTHGAVLVTILCIGKVLDGTWMITPLAVLPALLGFTLAAYALLLGFGDEAFRKFLARTGRRAEDKDGTDRDSTLMGVSAIFLHFVIVQMVALLLAIVGDAHPLALLRFCPWLYGHSLPIQGILHVAFGILGIFVFNLAIFMCAAAGFDIFHATRWYVQFRGDKSDAPESSAVAADESKRSQA